MTARVVPPTSPVGGTRLVNGIHVPVDYRNVPHRSLRFYVDNPRVHSALRVDGREPLQAEIERHLVGLKHVRDLARNIESEGGLHDAVIVRGGTMDVLEGNCRLAAYRYLSRGGDPRWDDIRCKVLPPDVDDDLVFSLLAQYHINGKLAWAPFEQAGFFFREFINDDSSDDRGEKLRRLARKGGGISVRRAGHLVNVYGFMFDHEDVSAEHWSHYDEYFKSREISKARLAHPKLDERFVAVVPTVPAEDVRKLAKFCTNDKILKKFIAGSVDVEQASELFNDTGANADAYQKLSKFRAWLARDEVQREIAQYGSSEHQKVALEIKKLALLTSRMSKRLGEEKS